MRGRRYGRSAWASGNCVSRLRKGPSAPSNPVAKPPPGTAALPVQGLRFYVRADAGVIRDGNNRVQRWNNQMGSGKDAAQSTAAAQPLWVDKAVNGKPALRFTGTEFLKTTFVPATGATPRTGIAVLANMPSKPGQWSLSFHYGDTQDDECYGMNAGSGGFGNYYFGSGLGSSQKPGAAPVIVTVRYDGTEDRVYVNGVEKGAKQIALKTGSGGMRIGCKVADGVYPYKGDIAEILIYDRALTDAERLAVEVYLNAKYSVYEVAPAEK
jgi:large repetitive protein